MNTIKLLCGLVALGASLFAWWVKAKNDKEALKVSLRKETDEAIKSGDVAVVNRLIERIKRLR